MGIGILQTAIILVLGHLLFAVPLGGSLCALAATTLAFIGASLALGLVLSTMAGSQLQAMQMRMFILLPSIMLSGFMFPYEGIPVPAQYIAEVLPATHFIRAIRAVLLRDAGLAEIAADTLWLVGFMLVGLLVASLRFKKRQD
ncbi:ABC transporter permease [Thiocapsa sp. UBA6158]|uniref:ABC transporter permease n=1 Tax=Thiocapsa sp. UBA6158 TaxID=1947692 RepID=UPI0039C90AC9